MNISEIPQEGVSAQAFLGVGDTLRVQVQADRLPAPHLGDLQEKAVAAPDVKKAPGPAGEVVEEATELLSPPIRHSLFPLEAGPFGGVGRSDVCGRRPRVTLQETTLQASDHPSGPPLEQRIGLMASAEGTVHSLEFMLSTAQSGSSRITSLRPTMMPSRYTTRTFGLAKAGARRSG